MSTSSLVPTVLEIEREAQAFLAKAEHEATTILAEAASQRDAATKTAEEATRKEVEGIEAAAAAERAKKVQELSAAGDAALSAIRNISEAAFAGGVQHVMKALTGK